MHFPVLPLIPILVGMHDIHVGMSAFVVFVAFVVAAIYLIYNTFAPKRYTRKNARNGLISLGIAIFVWIVGMAYILTVAASLFVLYLVVYWVMWRFLLKNIIAAIWPDAKMFQAKTEKKHILERE